jgi:hypothetical protein
MPCEFCFPKWSWRNWARGEEKTAGLGITFACIAGVGAVRKPPLRTLNPAVHFPLSGAEKRQKMNDLFSRRARRVRREDLQKEFVERVGLLFLGIIFFPCEPCGL